MRAAQVRATLLWALCAVAAAQEGVPRRGPPRGPIKEDKSTFFGKEGDQSRSVRQSTGSPRRGGVDDAPSTPPSSRTRRRVEGVLRLALPRAGRSARPVLLRNSP